MTIDIYLTPTSPPCRTVLFVAKQLNIDLNQKVISPQSGENKTPEFLKVILFYLDFTFLSLNLKNYRIYE